MISFFILNVLFFKKKEIDLYYQTFFRISLHNVRWLYQFDVEYKLYIFYFLIIKHPRLLHHQINYFRRLVNFLIILVNCWSLLIEFLIDFLIQLDHNIDLPLLPYYQKDDAILLSIFFHQIHHKIIDLKRNLLNLSMYMNKIC